MRQDRERGIVVAVLAWAKEERVFIKVQEGIGDNLTRKNRAEGHVDYVLWSMFRPECLDIDQETAALLPPNLMPVLTHLS